MQKTHVDVVSPSLFNLQPQTFPLSHYKTLSISGEDASSFLQSQTTNNISKLRDNEFHFDALLDIAGRVESFFIVLKNSDKNFKLLIPNNIFENSLERIQKFHITEDVEFQESNVSYFLHLFCTEASGYFGKFGTLDALISDKHINNGHKNISYEDLATLCSVPILNKTIHTQEIINNTLLANIALDLNKGCFLGQETVAKINSRRGAAKAAVMLVGDSKIEVDTPTEISSMNKKIGEVYYSLKFKNKFYSLSFLNRENRVEGKEIFAIVNGEEVRLKTQNYPIITLDSLIFDLYQSAVLDFQSSDETKAIEKLKRIIKLDPKFYDAYESLGVIYGRQEKFDEAIEVMHELEKINPKSVMAQTNLSMFYMKVGEIETAEKHKSNATINQFEKFGEEAEIKREKEKALKEKELELKRREKMFEQVLKIDPDDALASYGLGELRLEQNKLDESITLLSKAIETDKKYSVAYLALAKAYIKNNQIEIARDILQRGIEVSSKNGDLMPANEMQSMLLSI